jgi:peptide/nickel transport system ATP-binding protein
VSGQPLLGVRGLTVAASGARTIVEDVSFDLRRGEVLGLVGESGSGKTVTCRALIRLLPAASLRVTGGAVLLQGEDLLVLDEAAMRAVRGRRIGMIFQNPASHLDPVMRIGDQVAEAIRQHRALGRREARAEAVELLRQVGIPDPAHRARRYPHDFSGGMRQRAMIAAALACDPDLLIADEPTTALDVTVQAQILRLLLELRDRRGLSIILVTHDLGVVAQTCDSVAVMYAGRLCERGPKRDVLAAPLHRYTLGLMRCQPGLDPGGRLLPSIAGQPPSPDAVPPGCPFHPRCAQARERCRQDRPRLAALRPAHEAACHYPASDTPAERS